MFKLVVLSFLVAYVYAAWYDEQEAYWIKKINSQNLPWKAGHNPYLKGRSKEQIMRLMGTKMDGRGLATSPKVYHNVDKAALPVQFTAGVDNWKVCANTIGYIKDQADCGSCWAVAASEVVEDRICIANNGAHLAKLNEATPAIVMSAEQIMACCQYCGQGCQGGYPIDAMKFWQQTGVVTGGWYGSNCGCQPYMIPPCGPNGCSGPEANTPACSASCRSGYKIPTVAQAAHKAATYYSVGGTAPQVQQEIYMNGPVECAFDVYANFMSYAGGIYNQTGGSYLGGHAVKIIGWGHDTPSGMDYWLINNSWNVTWGLSGQFKFLRGTNLAGMESQCVAGKAKAPDNGYALTC